MGETAEQGEKRSLWPAKIFAALRTRGGAGRIISAVALAPHRHQRRLEPPNHPSLRRQTCLFVGYRSARSYRPLGRLRPGQQNDAGAVDAFSLRASPPAVLKHAYVVSLDFGLEA
jgi:hypothetical protein